MLSRRMSPNPVLVWFFCLSVKKKTVVEQDVWMNRALCYAWRGCNWGVVDKQR